MKWREDQEENCPFKKVNAEEQLKAGIARDIFAKNVVKRARLRELACKSKLEYNVSIRIVCVVLSISYTATFTS